MDSFINGGVSIAIAIVGVALLAVLVSRNSNTAGILTAGGGAFSTSLLAAEAPVLGASFSGFGDGTYGPGFHA